MATLTYRTVKNALVDRIREEILQGTYPPGQHLRLEELARRFGVSHMPIREALRHLEAEGIVTNIPHKGTFVTRLTAAEMEDIYDIRSTLEALATRLAVPRLTPEVLAELEQILEAMDGAMDALPTFIMLNHRFHMTLYSASGRRHLCELLRTLRYRMHHYMYTLRAHTSDLAPVQQEHRAILAACRAGDAEEAARRVRDHVAQVGQAIIQSMVQAEAQDGAGTPPDPRNPCPWVPGSATP